MMKKWFCILLALGFCFTTVHAYDDDDDWDDYEEEAAPKKGAPKKAQPKKAASSDSESRMGFMANISGSQETVSFVYDLGTGMQLGLGLGLNRWQYTLNDEAVSDQSWMLVLDFAYSLGKGLLSYGVGASATAYKPNSEGEMDKGLRPYFYITTELLKNVSLSLTTGIAVNMLADGPPLGGGFGLATDRMDIRLNSSVGLIFYFM